MYHLAQVNVARMRAPLDDPRMADFVNNLEPINALADTSPGFVWRLQDDAGDATSLRVFDDAMIIVNLSVWEDVAPLKHYVYKSRHVDFVRRRKEWFALFDGAYYALWWVPVGHQPSADEAKRRLFHLRAHGESPTAFSFKKIFAPPQVQEQSVT